MFFSFFDAHVFAGGMCYLHNTIDVKSSSNVKTLFLLALLTERAMHLCALFFFSF